MGRNRTPESQEKRRRELEKQQKRQAKMARRLEKNAQKRAVREAGPLDPVAVVLEPPPAVPAPPAGQP
jgi:hypothetical protein